MADDDLLREASDPATPGERLRVLWRAAVNAHDEYRTPHIQRVLVTILRNPSLPLDFLSEFLLGLNFDAWFNPTVPLLVWSQPVYRDAAYQTLLRLTPGHSADTSFEGLIKLWAVGDLVPLDEQQAQVHALARHLASLFGLPWTAKS